MPNRKDLTKYKDDDGFLETGMWCPTCGKIGLRWHPSPGSLMTLVHGSHFKCYDCGVEFVYVGQDDVPWLERVLEKAF